MLKNASQTLITQHKVIIKPCDAELINKNRYFTFQQMIKIIEM